MLMSQRVLCVAALTLAVSSCSMLFKQGSKASAPNFPPPPVFNVSIDYKKIAEQYKDNDPQELTIERRLEIEQMVDGIAKNMTIAYDELKQSLLSQEGPRTFASTIAPIDKFYHRFRTEISQADFYMNVHPSNYLREVARAYYQEADRYGILLAQDEAIYAMVREAAENDKNLGPEEAMIVKTMLDDYRMAGMDKSAEVRAKIRKLKEQLSELETEFSQNIATAQDPTPVTKADLVGMDDRFLEQLTKKGEGYEIPLYHSVVAKLMQHCANENLRKTVFLKFKNVAKEKNRAILKRVQGLRYELAGLLGFPTHDHAQLSQRMAQDPERVLAFLGDLKQSLLPLGAKEKEQLTALKRETTKDPKAEVYAWDFAFYSNLLEEKTFNIDSHRFPEYFQLERVINDGLFAVYQTIFSLQFKKVDQPTYHPDVMAYEVYSDGKVIGSFLMDLFPRPNKYNHAAEFSHVARRIGEDGAITLPKAAIVCNFTKPTEKEPSLLQPGEVTTFFHEFGHLMHELLSETRYASLSGTNVKHDFVEAPSQTLERWPMDDAVLNKFAKHYKTGEPIPANYIQYMKGSSKFLAGLKNLYQILYATYDLTTHGAPPFMDSTELWEKLAGEITYGLAYAKGTSPEASFGHLMGYDAGYYGYLWSEMMAADIFSTFKEKGTMNVEQGMRLRKGILAKGGSVDPNVLMREFLGREPSNKAFLKEIGVQ